MIKELILTLGKGKRTINGSINSEDNISPYQSAEYKMEGHEPQRSVYVGSVLADNYCPDQIIIIGTAGSSWDSIYYTFADKDKKSTQITEKLYAMQEDRVLSKDIQGCQNMLDKIFKDVHMNGAPIMPVLISEGIKQEEMQANYAFLYVAFKKAFAQKRAYDVAFDITHSYRSLPLYTMVVLNYLKACENIDLNVSHIYYGCLEAAHENKNIAPVVDLSNMTGLQSMVNAISLFEKTGISSEITEKIPSGEADFKEAISNFDWAVQQNEIETIDQTIQELSKVLLDNEEHTLYGDLKTLLNTELRHNFPEYFSSSDVTENKILREFILQVRLLRWYQSQKRYGLMISVETECVRTFMTILAGRENNEKDRAAAVQQIENKIDNQAAINRIQDADVLAEIVRLFNQITPKRDAFAHNYLHKNAPLSKADKVLFDKLADDLEDVLENYVYCTEKLESLKRAYQRIKKIGNNHQQEAFRTNVILCSNQLSSVKNITLFDNSTYYVVPSEVSRKLKYSLKKADCNNDDLIRSAFILKEYLKDSTNKDKQYTVAIDSNDRRALNIYAAVLHSEKLPSVRSISVFCTGKGNNKTAFIFNNEEIINTNRSFHFQMEIISNKRERQPFVKLEDSAAVTAYTYSLNNGNTQTVTSNAKNMRTADKSNHHSSIHNSVQITGTYIIEVSTESYKNTLIQALNDCMKKTSDASISNTVGEIQHNIMNCFDQRGNNTNINHSVKSTSLQKYVGFIISSLNGGGTDKNKILINCLEDCRKQYKSIVIREIAVLMQEYPERREKCSEIIDFIKENYSDIGNKNSGSTAFYKTINAYLNNSCF